MNNLTTKNRTEMKQDGITFKPNTICFKCHKIGHNKAVECRIRNFERGLDRGNLKEIRLGERGIAKSRIRFVASNTVNVHESSEVYILIIDSGV